MTYRLSKADVLSYALDGAVTQRGVMMGYMSPEEEADLDKDIAELERRLEVAKVVEAARSTNLRSSP